MANPKRRLDRLAETLGKNGPKPRMILITRDGGLTYATRGPDGPEIVTAQDLTRLEREFTLVKVEVVRVDDEKSAALR